jgi:uncharacterized lipoprotein YajG
MKKSFFILLAFLLLASCEKDYLDINQGPEQAHRSTKQSIASRHTG